MRGNSGGDSVTHSRKDADSLPFLDSPGTYSLILEAGEARHVLVGALGAFELTPGFYVYVGSARGPGGLAARLNHHLRQTSAPHWHIDYVRRHTVIREVWYKEDASILEHQWASVMEGSTKATIPFLGFGSSDCCCRSHLFRFARAPKVSAFRRGWDAAASDHDTSPCPVMRWIAV